MSKHRVAPNAVCPYYLHEGSQIVYCDSLVAGRVYHVAFASATDAKYYKCAHCYSRSGCEYCFIHDMLQTIQKKPPL